MIGYLEENIGIYLGLAIRSRSRLDSAQVRRMIYIYSWSIRRGLIRAWGLTDEGVARSVSKLVPKCPDDRTQIWIDEYTRETYHRSSLFLHHYHDLETYFIGENISYYCGWFSEALQPISSPRLLPSFNLLFYKIHCLTTTYPDEFDMKDEIRCLTFYQLKVGSDLGRHSILLNNRDQKIQYSPGQNISWLEFNSEADLLREALKIFSHPSIHILVGFNNLALDDRYLASRFFAYNLETEVADFNIQPDDNKKSFLHFHSQQLNFDLLVFLRKYMNCKSSLLSEVVQSYLVNPDEKWFSSESRVERVLDYSTSLVQLFTQLNILTRALQMSAACYVSLEQLVSSTTEQLLQPLILIEGYRNGYCFAPKTYGKRSDHYRGGLVWLEGPGYYQNIGVLDFKNFYPSILQSWGLGPGSCREISTDEVEAGERVVVVLDETRSVVLNSSDRSLFPTLCQFLADRTNSSTGSPTDALFFRKFYKFLSNSLYGLLGSPSSRFYHKLTAETVTAVGREIISNAKKYCEEGHSLRVIAVDTDSLFVDFGESRLSWTEMGDKITRDLNLVGLCLRPDLYFEKLIFLAKKKYFGVLSDGSLKSSGIYRRDMSRHYRSVTTGLMTDLLRLENRREDVSSLADSYVRRVFNFNLIYHYDQFSFQSKIGSSRNPNIFQEYLSYQHLAPVPDTSPYFLLLETSPLKVTYKNLRLLPPDFDILLFPCPMSPVNIIDTMKSAAEDIDRIFQVLLLDTNFQLFQDIRMTLVKYRLVVYELKCLALGIAVNFTQPLSLTNSVVEKSRKRRCRSIQDYLLIKPLK